MIVNYGYHGCGQVVVRAELNPWWGRRKLPNTMFGPGAWGNLRTKLTPPWVNGQLMVNLWSEAENFSVQVG